MGIIDYWPIFVLAIAISVDGFGVGITYGLQKIKLGIFPLIIISGISTIAIYLACSIGAGIAVVLNNGFAERLGAFILIATGGWLVYSAFINNNGNRSENEELLFSFTIKPFGIIIKILKEPVEADFDSSGSINISEAIVLGLALALDALGAGLGTGLAGFSNLTVPVVIGIFNLGFVTGGYLLGRRVGDFLPAHFEMFPGFVIIMLGVINLVT